MGTEIVLTQRLCTIGIFIGTPHVCPVSYTHLKKEKLADMRWLQRVALWTIPLAYIGSQAGWVVAEVGRQPWAIPVSYTHLPLSKTGSGYLLLEPRPTYANQFHEYALLQTHT